VLLGFYWIGAEFLMILYFLLFRFQQPTTSKTSVQGSFECDVCGKVFPGRFKIRQHVPNHAKFAIYECNFCEKAFKLNTTLKIHITGQHLDVDKQFKCQICEKKLKNQKSLRAHLQTHNDTKPFECLICGKKI
jgi:KRAB domain-containing zinc finger protein